MKVKLEKDTTSIEVGIGWVMFYNKDEKTFNIWFVLGNKIYTVKFK